MIGDEIHELAYLRRCGHPESGLPGASPVNDGFGSRTSFCSRVHHMYGSQVVNGGTYTLLARPIGPPDPNGEFEPNDDTSRMQPLRFGQTRTGLLEDKADRTTIASTWPIGIGFD